MFEEMGFKNEQELHRLVSQVDLPDESFNDWKENDGTKHGIMKILQMQGKIPFPFDPLDFDIYHVGLSGGKDSAATMLWIIKESGWPLNRVRITFCDTDNEDDLTYNFLALLSERIWPVDTVYPELGFYELVGKKMRFPAAKSRFCTQYLKIIPSMRYIQELSANGEKVLLLSGIRKQEGTANNDRGDLEKFYYDDSYGCYKYLPVYEWGLDDIWQIHQKYLDIEDIVTLVENDAELNGEKEVSQATQLLCGNTKTPKQLKKELIRRIRKHGIPRNPLYDMGASRVGCYPCINSRKAEVRAMAKYRPSRIDFIREKEGTLGSENRDMYSSFFARNKVPEQHRSKEIVTKSGEEMMVATIDDVVMWSKTKHGGKQFQFDFLDDDQPLSCDLSGMCE